MRPPRLRARSRVAALLAACAAFGGAFATAPGEMRAAYGGAAAVLPMHAAIAPAPRPGSALRFVTPRRDPFADPEDSTAARDSVRDPSPYDAENAPSETTLEAIPPAVHALPANAGAPPPPFGGARSGTGTDLSAGPGGALGRPGPALEAIVTGPHPAALVADGGATHVVTVGDALSGVRIVAIDAAGVHLAGGTLLRLAATANGDR